jgi:hypothetical protein
LFFVPVLRPLFDHDAELAELNADRAAVQASAGRQGPLASALLVFDAGAPPGVSGISSARVDSLLGEPVPWRFPVRLIGASLATLSALSVLIWQVSEVASAHATLDMPFLSSRPCLVMVLMLPLLVGVAAFRRWRRAGGISRPAPARRYG